MGAALETQVGACSLGYVTHGFIDIKGHRFPSKLWLQSHYDKEVDFDHLFEQWAKLAKPSVGLLHLFSDPERSFFKGEDYSWFETGSFGGPAKPGLPNIGWAMAYGEEYASEVDVARITNAGFPVTVINNVVVVRIIEKFSDVIDGFERFSRRRAELKRLFRPDLFWLKEEPRTVFDGDK